MKITAFVKGDFIGHEGKSGVEVNVLKLVPQAQYITFEPQLVDNCFENTSRISSGIPPINTINFASFLDLENLEINGIKIL